MPNARTRKPARRPRKAAPKAAPKPRVFQLRAGDDEDTPNGFAVGAAPRISIGAGETFETNDPRLAARLAAHPELEEVTR